jgi:hypothetical protein
MQPGNWKYEHLMTNGAGIGYKVFGAGGPQFGGFGAMDQRRAAGGPISYTTKGAVRAYLRFDQPLPDGFQRLGRWPVEAFETILPPKSGQPNAPVR